MPYVSEEEYERFTGNKPVDEEWEAEREYRQKINAATNTEEVMRLAHERGVPVVGFVDEPQRPSTPPPSPSEEEIAEQQAATSQEELLEVLRKQGRLAGQV